MSSKLLKCRNLVKVSYFGNRLAVPIFRYKTTVSASPNVEKNKYKSPTAELSKTGTTLRVFKEKTTPEIVSAYLVFKLCKIRFLVTNNEKLMKLGYSVLGSKLFEKLMKVTFYGHFVGGENAEALRPLISRLEANGIGAILDYAVEKDISHDAAVEAEMESSLAEQEKSENTGSFSVKQSLAPEDQEELLSRQPQFLAHESFGDRRQDVISAKTYFYEDERSCDKNVEIFLQCIETASKCGASEGFAAIKLTSLGRPQFLMELSEVLTRTREFFDQISDSYPGDVLKRSVSQNQFSTGLSKMGIEVSIDEANNWFTFLDANKDGTFDLLDWTELVHRDRSFSKVLVAPDPETGEVKPILNHLSSSEEVQMKNMLQRLDLLAKTAKELDVKLMIDAEQTYFQPAISRLAMELMKVYNVERPIIFNTYQCYLKEAFNNMSVDMGFAQREGFYFGAKLVRGAYMDFERKRAKEIGYADPINSTYEATTRLYERVVGECLDEISAGKKVAMMVASHNEDSIEFTTERMKQLGIKKQDKQVYFGQLLGMCDRLSFKLGLEGYPVYKYVPFGPVKEVLPYLSRRAYENSSLLSNTQKEAKLLKDELKYRLKGLQ